MRRITALILLLCLSLWLHGCRSEESNDGSRKSDGTFIDTVNTFPTAAIARPQRKTFTEGDSLIISGTGTDREDGQLTGNSLQWWASKWWAFEMDTPAAFGPFFSPDTLSAGTYIITLKAIDSDGASSTDSINIRIASSQDIDPPPQGHGAEVVLHKDQVTRIVDAQGCTVLLGELKNLGIVDATFCKITFTLLDASLTPLEPVSTSSAYVQGTNKTLTEVDVESNAILEHDGDVGGFAVYTDIPDENIFYYDYEIDWREDTTSPPDADLVVDGPISNSADDHGFLELSGRIKNRGIKTALFGSITFILKDGDGTMIGLAPLNFVQGTAVYLPDVEGVTDTAILPGKTGIFTTSSITLYPNEVDLDHCYYTIAWFDCRETVSATRKKGLPAGCMSSAMSNTDRYDHKVALRERDRKIDELKRKLQGLRQKP
ncbi:MAG: hypothetical protein AB1611_20875 [bacterium]